jgi:nitrile hydratase subunit beta
MERRVHDRGGWPGAGPINKAEHELSMWEKRTDALMNLLRGKRLLRTDELRRAIESLAPDEYERLSYYERWIVAIKSLLIEKGLLTAEEIDRKIKEWGVCRS